MTKVRKRLALISLIAATTLATGELLARYYWGLGSPPLTMPDAKIEYMLKPNQEVYRFGNRFFTNDYGMRSMAFEDKHEGEELRVMVFGDSIINGGNGIDQDDLATSILQENLTQLAGSSVVIGNISAGSWGPGNWLAYAKKFGFFEADIAVLVISSHDYADIPTYSPLNRYHQPTKKPFSALTEAINRYAFRYLKRITDNEALHREDPAAIPADEHIVQAMNDLKAFLELAQSRVEHVVVLQHWDRKEVITGIAKPGNSHIRELVVSMGLTAVQLFPYFRQSMDISNEPFNDKIHPSQTGQQLIAQAIADALADNAL